MVVVCSDAGVDRDGTGGGGGVVVVVGVVGVGGGGEFRCKSVSVCEYQQLVSRGCGND